MSDNGQEIKEEAKSTGPKVIIQIISNSDNAIEMKSSMPPPMVVWIFLKIIFGLFMKENEPRREKLIITEKHGIFNFVRERFKR